MATAALYLASDLAEMITGHVLEVDGGRAISSRTEGKGPRTE